MDDTYLRLLEGIGERAVKTGVSPRLLVLLGMLEAEGGGAALPAIDPKPKLAPVLSPTTLDALCTALGCDTEMVADINCMDGAAWLMPGSFITLPGAALT